MVTVEDTAALLRRLRAPDGCPWDREQTAESLSRCMVEECAEYLDALDRHEVPEMLDELGDLLMNVVFQAVVAAEKGEFTLEDVVKNLNEKLIRRHPHVFGDAKVEGASGVVRQWETIKVEQEHRVREHLLDGVPAALSALNSAEKMQKKVAKFGFDWNDQRQILGKIREELAEFEQELARGDEESADRELGDVLFAVANLARFRKRRNSEELLRLTNAKFRRRFNYIEDALKRDGVPLAEAGLPRLESLWNEAKTKNL